MNISEIWKYDLRKGSTDHPANGACLFDAGMWLVYGRIGDNPPCSCPVIRSYAIELNDRMPDNQRQKLKPFILRVVGNRDPEAETARARLIVLETARCVVPLAFDKRFPKRAAFLRALADDTSYTEIGQICKKNAAAAASYAAAYATSYSASAAASAASYDAAAYAADTAAAAAAYAAVACAAASYAAADTAAAASYAAWDEAIKILDKALHIGKQSPEFDKMEVRRSVEMFETVRGKGR